MKPTKIDFYSVNDQDKHLYEFSSMIQLNTKKPLTKIVMTRVSELGLCDNVKSHIRNGVYFDEKISINDLKQKNVIKLYCLKAK